MEENYFLNRRSCRKFKETKINSEKLHDIIHKATKAPTCGNMQLYSVIITKDPFKIKQLSEFHYNQPAATTASVILTICADFNRFSSWCEQNKADAGYDNFHSFLMAATDAIILAQQIVTIAEMDGLATCYLGTVTYNAKKISEILDLPDLVVPVVSIAIGYPNEKGEETDRLPLMAIIHDEVYHKADPDTIRDFYSIHENNPANKKFIEENNKNNLAQVFSEIRYPRQVNEAISQSFIDLLKDKKFLD